MDKRAVTWNDEKDVSGTLHRVARDLDDVLTHVLDFENLHSADKRVKWAKN